MRVLHLIDGSTSVGAITSVKRLGARLKDKGGDVVFLSYNEPIPKEDIDNRIPIMFCDLRTNKILHQFATGELNKIIGLFYLSYYFILDLIKLNRFCRKYEITIVHTHYLNDNFLASFLKSKYKKVAHIRSIVNKNFFYGYGFKLFRYFIFKRSDIIIGISETVLKIFDFPSSGKLYVVYNGISSLKVITGDKNLRSRLKQEEKNKFLIGTVSRYNKAKGLDFLLDIIKEIDFEKYPVHFVIVAPDHNKKYKQHLLKKANNNGILNNISFVGSFPNANYFMSFFSLLIHPTLEREGFGNVVLEAHSAGVPVIATNCGGPSEIVQNKKSGFIIEKNCPHDFVKKIEFLYDNPSLLLEMKTNAFKIANQTKFQIENSTETVLKLYQRLC